jgi:hypothetical protein
MEEAIDLRYAITTRGAAIDDVARTRQFFEKIEILAQKGLDVRSRTWNALLGVRSYSAHRDTPISKADLGRAFQVRYDGSPEVALETALDRLLAIMQVLVSAPECSQIQTL